MLQLLFPTDLFNLFALLLFTLHYFLFNGHNLSPWRLVGLHLQVQGV